MFRFFVVALTLILFSLPAHATISGEQVDTYYQHCMSQTNPYISPETHDTFCQCTGGYMQSNMSMDDVMTMQGDDQAARDALNKMILMVYAPCMEFPVRDLIHAECMVKTEGQEEVCMCLSTEMSKFTAQNAQQLLHGILAENPNITDPMEPIVTSPEFERHEQQVAMQCLQAHMRQ